MFSHVFYEWSREFNSSLPPTLVPLSYPLPSKYIDHSTGVEHRVPPTYKTRLNAVPGLRVKIQYDLSAKIVRSRRRIPFMTKTTRSVSRIDACVHPIPLPPSSPLSSASFDRRFRAASADRMTDGFFFFPFLRHPCRIHVPFIYRPRHQFFERVMLPPNPRFRPGTSNSRPRSAQSARSRRNSQTQKVFVYTIPSLHGERTTEIKVRAGFSAM